MFGIKKKKVQEVPLVLPEHIGIIMDGNGRWAKRRGLPRTAGHTVGAMTFENICRYANSLGIQHITFYAFSTENWKRPPEEVSTLMKIFKDYLARLDHFMKDKIRIHFVGDLSPLTEELRQLMKEAEERTAHFTGLTVHLAINYGGRDELLHAFKCLGEEIQQGKRNLSEITEDDITSTMYQPLNVDLLIRPGGEQRLSNFLLWQCAYGEFYFCDTLWPDFNKKELDAALLWYSKRNRRFGGI